MKMYSMNVTELQKNANAIKEHLLSWLEGEGIISSGKANELAEQYSVIVYEKGMLGKAVDKVLGVTEDDCAHFKIVRVAK
jgi:hypothetical protein